MACARWNNGGDKAWLDLESSPFFPKGLPFGGLLPSGEDGLVGLLLGQPALVFWVGATVMDTLFLGVLLHFPGLLKENVH